VTESLRPGQRACIAVAVGVARVTIQSATSDFLVGERNEQIEESAKGRENTVGS